MPPWHKHWMTGNILQLILDAGLIQVVGIMPTLIITQVGIGRAMQDADATRMEQSKVQAQSPRSGYNRSLAENPDAFTPEPQRIYSRREEMRQHGYGRCPCGECSSSSQTFIMRDSHHHHHHHSMPSMELHRLPSFQAESPLQGLGIRPLPLPDPEQHAGFSMGFDPDNSFEVPDIPTDPVQWVIYTAPEFVEEDSRELSPDPYHLELGIARWSTTFFLFSYCICSFSKPLFVLLGLAMIWHTTSLFRFWTLFLFLTLHRHI